MSYWTVPGFSQMSNQGLFDRAAKHIATTLKPSKKGDNCMYSGSGCNASVFLRKEVRDDADDLSDPSWGGMVYYGFVPETHQDFVTLLQQAHDAAAEVPAKDFLPYYIDNMRSLADKNGLNVKVLKRFDKHLISLK